jgi:hypothetical protein
MSVREFETIVRDFDARVRATKERQEEVERPRAA